MARIKGRAKGAADFDGGVSEAAAEILRQFRAVQLCRVHQQSPLLRSMGLDAFVVPEEMEHQQLEQLGRLVADCISAGDAPAFHEIAARIDASPAEDPVDKLDSAIWRAWLMKRVGAVARGDLLGDSERVSIPELGRAVRATGVSVTDDLLRSRAKALGVRLVGAGRPRKSP